MTSLANKTALVTGASRGMGRATALALAAAGARVIVHYGRNADEAKSVVDQIRIAGGRADAVAADLAAPDGAHKLAAQIRDLIGGRLDVLVSNAGWSPDCLGNGSTHATRRVVQAPVWRRSARDAGARPRRRVLPPVARSAGPGSGRLRACLPQGRESRQRPKRPRNTVCQRCAV
jgi:NAD(P)-dependent dehydrogenase (short-subunit alcohol dehydrogenase family)